MRPEFCQPALGCGERAASGFLASALCALVRNFTFLVRFSPICPGRCACGTANAGRSQCASAQNFGSFARGALRCAGFELARGVRIWRFVGRLSRKRVGGVRELVANSGVGRDLSGLGRREPYGRTLPQVLAQFQQKNWKNSCRQAKALSNRGLRGFSRKGCEGRRLNVAADGRKSVVRRATSPSLPGTRAAFSPLLHKTRPPWRAGRSHFAAAVVNTSARK